MPAERRACATPRRGARSGQQKSGAHRQRATALWSPRTASLCEAALHSVCACQSHIAPTPMPHVTTGRARSQREAPSRPAAPRRERPAGQRQQRERRHDQHEQEVLEHVRAEEVPAASAPMGEREREDAARSPRPTSAPVRRAERKPPCAHVPPRARRRTRGATTGRRVHAERSSSPSSSERPQVDDARRPRPTRRRRSASRGRWPRPRSRARAPGRRRKSPASARPRTIAERDEPERHVQPVEAGEREEAWSRRGCVLTVDARARRARGTRAPARTMKTTPSAMVAASQPRTRAVRCRRAAPSRRGTA